MHNSYITFSSISQNADLGSQMQQYASLLAIAKHTKKKIVFPESCFDVGFGFKLDRVYDIEFNIKPDNFFQDFIKISPLDGLLPDSRVFDIDPDLNYDFTNLFHTYHYWYPDYVHEVDSLNWNKTSLDKAIYKLSKIKIDKELVSIHIRRGDYLLHDHFCKLDHDYYSKAIDLFSADIDKYHFVVFSNDIQWCKNNLLEESEQITFLDQDVDTVDMILMSMCDHNIIANSSFSWWAGFKNNNEHKIVVCPENYVKAYSPFSFLNSNYYLSNWKPIKNNDL
jgi:hypothetical protein